MSGFPVTFVSSNLHKKSCSDAQVALFSTSPCTKTTRTQTTSGRRNARASALRRRRSSSARRRQKTASLLACFRVSVPVLSRAAEYQCILSLQASVTHIARIYLVSAEICAVTSPMVSKCHNPRCSRKFRYFGDGKLFEFPAASTNESSQLFWLCSGCMTMQTLRRDDDGEVRLLSKASLEHRRPQAKRFGRAS